MTRIRRFSFVLVATPIFAGCYAYVPTSNTRPVTGAEVQLALTDSGTLAMIPFVGPSVGQVSGRFIGDSVGSYLLSVTRTARRDGAETDWRGERIAVSRALVSEVSIRRFSPGRTILFSALTGGALVAIVEAFAGGGGATTPGATPTGPPSGK
ncbi:MAG: hypothetical protein ACJ796_00145 [Gemmatimonadaceae bacterium]